MLGEHLLHRALADSVRPTTAALARLADSTALAARHGTARRMQIFATALSGQKLTLEVEGDMTVRKLREVIRAEHGIETEAVVVSVARTSDVSMEDARTLASYGVRREAELRLVNRGEQRHGRGQSAIRRTADAKQRVEKACGALSARWDQLEEQRYELASRKAALAERNSSHKPKKKLRLNVGGTPFTIQRSVLASRPRTRLGALASGIHDADLLRDKKGHIFLDLNPLCFRAIVDYLTALELGKGAVTLVVPTGLEATMAHMVEFFGISEEVGSEPQPAPAVAAAEEGEPPEDVEPEPERDPDDSAGWDRPIEATPRDASSAGGAQICNRRACGDGARVRGRGTLDQDPPGPRHGQRGRRAGPGVSGRSGYERGREAEHVDPVHRVCVRAAFHC